MAERRSYGKGTIIPKGASGSHEITVTLKDRAGWTTTEKITTNINFLWDRVSVGDYVRLDFGEWENDYDKYIDSRIKLTQIKIGAEKGQSADNSDWGWRVVHVGTGSSPIIYLWHTNVTAYATVTWGNKLDSALSELGRWCDRTYGHDSKGRGFLSAYIPGWNGSSATSDNEWGAASSAGITNCGKRYWTYASGPKNDHSTDPYALFISENGGIGNGYSGSTYGVRPTVKLKPRTMCEATRGKDQCGHTAWILE